MTDDPHLARLLDAWVPPPLPAGFAETLVARTEARQVLPPVAPRRHRLRGAWSRTPRLVVGGVAFGLMTATAAAAAGVFGNVGITIPAWQRTVEKVTGVELAEPGPVVTTSRPIAPAATESAQSVDSVEPAPALHEIVADGRIESRAELDAMSAAVDARRIGRQAQARERRDARVDATVAERRAQGLPAPTDEQLAAMRARRDARTALREAAATARRTERREALGQRIDNGEVIDIQAERARARERFDERLTPRQRERLERWRARRGGGEVPQAEEPETVEADPSPRT